MTVTKKKLIAISGSTRAQSTNLLLIQAITRLAAGINITIFIEIASLPHFNPDLDTDTPPPQVTAFRRLLREADGILICTPEYAMGVPGTLKNAIDWTVSSCEFSGKPTALITASSVGQKGHAALLETLQVIEASLTSATQLIIPFVKTKIDATGTITDPATLAAVTAVMEALGMLMMEGEQG